MTITTPQARNHFAAHGHHRLSYERITPDATNPTETLVLLHSLLAGRAEFAQLRGLLASSFRLILPDARGHGASAAIPDQRYTIQTAASELDAILDDAGEGQVHLLGHDLGGAVAIAYATVRPERIRSLTLIDPAVLSLLAGDPDPAVAAAYEEARSADALAADTAYKGVTDRAVDQYLGPRTGPDWRATAPKPVLGTIRRHAAALAGSLAALSTYSPDVLRLGALSAPTAIISTATARPVARFTNQRLASLLPGSTHAELPAGDPGDLLTSPLSGAAAVALAASLTGRSQGR
jgi:pimeloyl-ACP methyl ester carboxylesterase